MNALTANFGDTTNQEKDSAPDKVRNISKTRVQFEFTPRSMKLLTELKDRTEAASYAEVVKNALKIYDGLIAENEKGADFFVSYDGSPPAPFKMFL